MYLLKLDVYFSSNIYEKYIDIVIGQSLKKDLKEDTVLSWENI